MSADNIRNDMRHLQSIRTVSLLLLSIGLAAPVLAEDGKIRKVQSVSLTKSPDRVAMSGDGATVAAISGRTITTFHRPTNAQKQWQTNKRIVHLSLTANGQLLAVATRDPTINVYTSRSGKLAQQVHRRDALAFLRKDGQLKVGFAASQKGVAFVTSSDDAKLQVWSIGKK